MRALQQAIRDQESDPEILSSNACQTARNRANQQRSRDDRAKSSNARDQQIDPTLTAVLTTVVAIPDRVVESPRVRHLSKTASERAISVHSGSLGRSGENPASDFGPEGWGFESLRGYHRNRRVDEQIAMQGSVYCPRFSLFDHNSIPSVPVSLLAGRLTFLVVEHPLPHRRPLAVLALGASSFAADARMPRSVG